jgi:hypothetical protein
MKPKQRPRGRHVSCRDCRCYVDRIIFFSSKDGETTRVLCVTERRGKEETRSRERWKMWAPLIGLFGPQTDAKQPSKNGNPSVTSLVRPRTHRRASEGHSWRIERRRTRRTI